MKKEEFHLGQDFYTNTGSWRCTDIGSRVIVAIHLNQEDAKYYNGPPYPVPELVFDEYDMNECSLEPIVLEKVPEEIIKNKKFNELHDAFIFVSSSGYGENTAILDTQTGKIYYRSEFADMDEIEEMSDQGYNAATHIEIPHKEDLELGRNLVYEFVEQYIPEDEHIVNQIFRKRGAYSRYKDFLESKGKLQQWYDFENNRELLELLQWCKENEIDIKTLES